MVHLHQAKEFYLKNLSKHLNFEILDSGLLYRAYAYLFNLNNDHDQTKSDLKKINFRNDPTKIKVFFENREISNDLRSEDCAKKASELSAKKLPETILYCFKDHL